MSKIAVFAVIAMVFVAFCVMPVAASNADNDLYTSKYVATKIDYPTTGSLSGAVRCHNDLLTVGVTITDPNGIVTPVDLRADGTFDINDLAPGEYVMNIADGNGGQPESAKFTIRAGYTSFLESELLGHAVSPADEPAQLDVIKVVEATYGMMMTVIDREAVPAVPGIAEVNHTVHHNAVTHQQKVIDVPAQPATPDTYNCVGHNHGAYDKQTNHGQTTYVFVGQGHGDYTKVPGHAAIPEQSHMVTVIDVAAYDEIVIDSPAVPAIPAITELSHVEGSYIDVTAQVQQAIDGGAREFVFNNGMNPGGIVNADQTAVLVPIADPAYGQVKAVTIQVTVNGIQKNIDVNEYDLITI